MSERAYLHVGGPSSSGKTAFVEAILSEIPWPVLVARCHQDAALREGKETRPRGHPELRRYRQAGAEGTSLYAFPEEAVGSEDFFCTRLMENYSTAVIVEGELPLTYVDLDVFVAPPLKAGETLFVGRIQDHAAETRAKADAWERLLREPDGAATWMGEVMGDGPIVDYIRKHPGRFEDVREKLRSAVAAARKAPPKATEQWALADPYRGVEQAGLVVVNLRGPTDREPAERLLTDLARLRKDEALFQDILAYRGNRSPITAVAANLADPRDAGRRKALARVRRAVRAKTSRG